jgi:competence protein ComEC
MTPLLRSAPHCLLAALCGGVAAANLIRLHTLAGLAALGAIAAIGAVTSWRGVAVGASVLAVAGWCWGSARLDRLDQTALAVEIGTAQRALVTVTAPPRRGRFDLKMPVEVRRFGPIRLDEPAQLELPLGRAPPQGSVLEVRAEAKLPRGSSGGFDERTWLRRRGIHVVLAGDRWRLVGRRGGLGGVADRLRRWLADSVASRLHGERRGVLLGVVLGDEAGLDEELRDRFRASGLYHLLAVSGQNVVLVAGGALGLAWLLGLPRWLGHLGALASIAAYVLAVGPQPSVIRAGIVGALGSMAWLAARSTDKWYFLLLGAFVLLAWNPYVVLDAGFQLSFCAVVSIFTLFPRLRRVLEGYPLPAWLRDVSALSTACGIATAPVLWFQFQAIPLVSVPANAVAAPAVVPLLGLALSAALVHPFAPGIAAALAQLNGLCAAYLAGCAKFFGSLPFAQVRSGWAAAALLLLAVGTCAYAWDAWRS